ncbi:MAG TPA: hypothetical protein VIU40_05945 [Geobacteraceae bacterium]
MLKAAAEVASLIRDGRKLALAASEELLAQLPAGDWIGGTIPYFMTDEGGLADPASIFVTELPGEVRCEGTAIYHTDTLPRIVAESPENGFTFVIMPAGSDVLMTYAREAPDYEQMFRKPILGWVSGVPLTEVGKIAPKVVDGRTRAVLRDRAVAMHCSLPARLHATVGIVNLFRQGDGDTITFPSDGFKASECWVNGRRQPFAAYLSRQGINTQLPLVANYSGTMINVAIQNIDAASGEVSFFAPVFEGVAYRFAAPIGDYVTEFEKALPSGIEPVFSCNCILNYSYSKLEGRVVAGMRGPFTFGEIAYQLLSQTLVYLTLDRD